MASTLLHSETRRLYSWWWDSHISPKNSKWLQENLADMDSKVKEMIKLIEEDADSFARRAEMYYKKRPELMKLVEEFYRAYRALAERYDHANKELRQAHRTMVESFPNQESYVLTDDSQSGSSEPHTPEIPHPLRAAFDLEDLQKGALGLSSMLNSIRKDGVENTDFGTIQKGLKQLNEMFGPGYVPEKMSEESDQTFLDGFSPLAMGNQKKELSNLLIDKEDAILKYQQCLDIISSLENKIALAEETSQMHNEQLEREETEVSTLKQELLKLQEDKEFYVNQYEQCLVKIGELEREVSRAQEDAKRLSGKIQEGDAKLMNMETLNISLQSEAESLAQNIAIKDQELLEKQNELEKLQILLKDEYSKFAHVETSLTTLQKLHSQSQEEQQSLTLELKNKLQMMKELETCNHNLEDDMQRVKEENHTLNELNNFSNLSLKTMQDEVFVIKEMKEKLEQEVALQLGQSNGLQEEVFNLKEEIKCLNCRYNGLMEQLQLVGLSPEGLKSSVKQLQDQNLNLTKVCNNHIAEKTALYEKLKDMDNILQKNTILEKSLSVSDTKLEMSTEEVKKLQGSYHFLCEEKSVLLVEKASLLNQLQVMADSMQKLSDTNTLLDNSLSAANIELEGLRAQSRSFEELCEFLKQEKSDLLKERSALASQLVSVEERFGNMENRFTRLEGKYVDLEKEKESTLVQVEQLRDSLGKENQERAFYAQLSESRWTDTKNDMHVLQEECKSNKKDFEEQLDKAVNAQVEIIILQKFIEDLEQKNVSLLLECQKHVEASKFSDKLISELEIENMEQEVEAELLLDEIENMRLGIYQVFRALYVDTVGKHEDKIEQEQSRIPSILGGIHDLKSSLLKNEDEKCQLVVENSVLLSLLGQPQLDGAEIESQKQILENEFKVITEQHGMLQKDKNELLEMNRRLKLDVCNGHQQEKILNEELEAQDMKLERLQGAFLALQEENSKGLEENRVLLKTYSELKGEMCTLEEENGVLLQEAAVLSNMSLVFQNCGTEKMMEVNSLAEALNNSKVINSDLKQKIETLGQKLDIKEAENRELKENVEKLQKELHNLDGLNDQLKFQTLIEQDILKQKAVELLEAEKKLKLAHDMNVELCRTVEELKRECEESKLIRKNVEKQMIALSEFCAIQKAESEHLQEVNKDLESEVGILNKTIEEQRVREEHLTLELQEKSNEFELWDVEAASFYFDLQISSVREVLLENKIQELTDVCESLGDESVTKNVEIEQMKETVGSLECEIDELKTQMSAYVPVIASLRTTVESLEQSALSQTNVSAAAHPKQVVDELNGQHCEMGYPVLKQDLTHSATEGISFLQEMETRIKAIETEVLRGRNRVKMEKTLNTNADAKRNSGRYVHQENGTQEEIELAYELSDKLRRQKTDFENSKVRNASLMKDIPLDRLSDRALYGRRKGKNGGSGDQMLELWESAEHEYSTGFMVNGKHKHPNRRSESGGIVFNTFDEAERRRRAPSPELQIEKELGVDKLQLSTTINDPRTILNRLAYDARKLADLQTNVQDLKRKVAKAKIHRKANDPEYERVKMQLLEVEETIQQLMDTNDQLEKDTEDQLSILDRRNSAGMVEVEEEPFGDNVAELARNESEKIVRLQLLVQSIEYVLKLEDERKPKPMIGFSGSKTSSFFRNLVSSRRRNGQRRMKSRFCGCMNPPISEV